MNYDFHSVAIIRIGYLCLPGVSWYQVVVVAGFSEKKLEMQV
jgi:hypothetical protein